MSMAICARHFIAANQNAKLDFTATETPDKAVSKVVTRAADIALPRCRRLPTSKPWSSGEVEHVFIVGRCMN